MKRATPAHRLQLAGFIAYAVKRSELVKQTVPEMTILRESRKLAEKLLPKP